MGATVVVGATVVGDAVVEMIDEQLTGGSTRSLHEASLGW